MRTDILRAPRLSLLWWSMGHRSHGESFDEVSPEVPSNRVPCTPGQPYSKFSFAPGQFAPFVIISFFFAFNFTGIFLSPAMAPVVNAANQVETIPADIPLSGDCDLDWIIFRAGEKQGVDPRFIHAVIKQESKYDPKAVSHAGAQGLMQMMPATGQRFGLKDPFDARANVEAGTKYLEVAAGKV